MGCSEMTQNESKFLRAVYVIVDMMIINCLVIISCTSILTSGVAFISGIELTGKILRGTMQTSVLKEYVLAFRRNIPRGLALGILQMFFLCLIVINLNAHTSNVFEQMVLNASLLLLSAGVSFVFLIAMPYAARYQDSLKKTMIMSVRIVLKEKYFFLPSSVLISVGIVLTVLSQKFLLFVIYFLTFGGCSVICICTAFMAKCILKKYES